MRKPQPPARTPDPEDDTLSHWVKLAYVTMRREMEALAATHEELGNIQTTYTEALKRFAKDLVPRLGRLDKRLEKLGDAIGTTGSPSGD